MTWWYWLVLGLILVGAEIVSPGFYLLFFGIAALAVGTLAGLEIIQQTWLEWLLFSVLAVASLLLLRGPLLRMTRHAPIQTMDSMVGESATLLEDLPPGHTGKAELRGTTWTTRAEGSSVLTRGQHVIVTRVDGLMLWVKPE